MPQLSAFLIVKNEAADLAGCLASLKGLVDEVVIVIDSLSSDATAEIAQRSGAKVFTRVFDGFGPQKQFALDQTTGEWVLSIDADERVGPALAEEIRSRIGSEPLEAGFKMRRNFYFLTHHLRFGGLGKDWVLRLFRRSRGHFKLTRVHERVEVEGPVGRLREPLEHRSYPTLHEYLDKREHYTTLAAQDLRARGRRFSWRDYLRPAWEMANRILFRGAWLDGRAGLTYARLSAQSTWIRASKLRALQTSTSETASTRRILLVRTDRLGDVLLTTPVSRRLREVFPQAHITWLVRSYTAPLLQNNPDVDDIWVDQDESVDVLVDRLREGQFDVAIAVYPRWRIAWTLWRAGIPVRIGPASKWYSAFFSYRIWQHRSKGERHEADYNLELLEPLGVPFQRTATRMVLTLEERAWARVFLEGHRISFGKPVVCLHPGSGGSSERWPLSHFMELGDRLQEAGYDVIVTGGPGENYQNIMIDQMRRIPVFVAAGSVSVRQLASIFSCVNLVVSNSTGPLHMAVAVGTPTVSVYSPIPACHPQRWGPYPSYAEGGNAHVVFMPVVTENSVVSLSSVSVESVLEACRKRLGIAPGVSVAL